MEREALATAMKASISEVLETMFFLPIDFVEGADPGGVLSAQGSRILSAGLNFKGPVSGCLLFHVPDTLARSMTASFMGQGEEDISREHVDDTMKEILNMVCGNAFGRYDMESIFNLGIPEMVRDGETEDPFRREGEEIFVGINTLEERLAFHLFYRE